jgi:hypothetical protein
MGRKLLIVLGGASCVWKDYQEAQFFCENQHVSLLAINDMIVHSLKDVDYAVTLHPEKVETWLKERESRNLNKPAKVFSFREYYGFVSDICDYRWDGVDGAYNSGSSGLFSIKVGFELGYERVILCGVPMEQQFGHFFDEKAWEQAEVYRQAWLVNKEKLIDKVRSMSGWTREILGYPSTGWIEKE